MGKKGGKKGGKKEKKEKKEKRRRASRESVNGTPEGTFDKTRGESFTRSIKNDVGSFDNELEDALNKVQNDKSDDGLKKSTKLEKNDPEKENSKPEITSPKNDRSENGNGHNHNGTALTPNLEEKLDLDSKSPKSPKNPAKEEYTVLRNVPEYKPAVKAKPERLVFLLNQLAKFWSEFEFLYLAMKNLISLRCQCPSYPNPIVKMSGGGLKNRDREPSVRLTKVRF